MNPAEAALWEAMIALRPALTRLGDAARLLSDRLDIFAAGLQVRQQLTGGLPAEQQADAAKMAEGLTKATGHVAQHAELLEEIADWLKPPPGFQPAPEGPPEGLLRWALRPSDN